MSHRVTEQHYNCVRMTGLAIAAATLILHCTTPALLDSCVVNRSDLAIDHHAHAHSSLDVDPAPPTPAATGGSAPAANANTRDAKKKRAHAAGSVLFGLLSHGASESVKWWCLAVCFGVLCAWKEESYPLVYVNHLIQRRNKSSAAQLSPTASGESGAGDSAGAAADDAPPLWSGYGLSITYVCLSYLWYLSIYFLCNALKNALDDHTCHDRHANSVSGHFLFHLFALSQLLHIHLLQLTSRHPVVDPRSTRGARLTSKRLRADMLSWTEYTQRWVDRYVTVDLRTRVFSLAYVVFAILSLNTLSNTYFWGFHSLRQVLYGSALAFLSQWLFLNLLHTFLHFFPTHRRAHYLATTQSSVVQPFPVPNAAHAQLHKLSARLTAVVGGSTGAGAGGGVGRTEFPLFLYAILAGVQLACLCAAMLFAGRHSSLVYAEDVAMCAALWLACGAVYHLQLRNAALNPAARKLD